MSKYGNKRTVLDGITFHSKAEAHRYAVLKLYEAAGQISDLELQPKFPIMLNGVKVFTVIADFAYRMGGERRVIDVKGCDNAISKLKRKCVAAQYGITIEIVRA